MTQAASYGPEVLASCAALDLELRTDTTFATAYLGGVPVASIWRGRVYSSEPAWSARACRMGGAEFTITAPTAPALVARLRRHFLAHHVTTVSKSGLVEHLRPYTPGEAGRAMVNAVLAAAEAQGMRDTYAAWTAYRAAQRALLSILRDEVSAVDVTIGQRTVSFVAGR